MNAKKRPVSFYENGYDISEFDEIQVPQHIELAGYDKIHYINTMYPWEGHEYRRPAGTCNHIGEGMFSEASYNPTGSYVRFFDLEEALIGKRVILSFEGAEQAIYVWINGEFVGYAEDSFTVSEFDITPYVKETGNRLCVEVHKRSTAAFLEDQDFFRFFGLFRDVNLYGLPDIHVSDLWIHPKCALDGRQASMEIELKTTKGKTVSYADARAEICLLDGHQMIAKEEASVSESFRADLTINEPVQLWNCDDPKLYQVEIRIFDGQGDLIEIIPYQVGFRTIYIEDGIIKLNGRRLIINGVNRHEWNAKGGRCISENDEIYVMAEVNLESHGSWQKMGAVEPSWNVPGSVELWQDVVLDRVKSNFEMFKNHTSVLFWSLGNESYAGEVLKEMNAYYKKRDPGRLVHYEGVFQNRDYEDTISDVESQMYAPPGRVREYLENEPKKPFILCEYMHDMGNSLGGMKSYIDLLDQYEKYQGGFIWDYIDQALLVKDEITGREVLRYGGDFDDRPSDYEFSGNGIIFADRTEKPAMREVKYYYGLQK